MEQAVIHSPLGPLTLFAEDDHLTALVYGDYGSYDDLPLLRGKAPVGSVFRRSAASVFPPPQPGWNGIPAPGLAEPVRYPIRKGNLLPGAGGPSGVSPGVPGGGTGQREEPPAHSHPLPPGHRRGRNPGRLFQRSGAQAVSAEAGRALHPRVQTAQTGGKTGGESPVRRCPTSRPAGLLSGERRLAGFPSEKPLSQAKRCLGQGFAVFEMERDRKETGAPLGINVCLSGGSPLARLSALLAHHPGIRRMTRSKAPFSGQPCRPRL